MKILGNVLIVLAGLILLADKFVEYYNINLNYNYGFSSTTNLIFSVQKIIAMFLLMIVIIGKIKYNLLSFFFIIYTSFLELFWIFFSKEFNDKSYFNIYAFGASVFILSIFFLLRMNYSELKEDKEKIAFLKSLLKLHDVSYRKMNNKK